MKLTMLGTGNAAVTRCYNTCFVLENARGRFLVDGGGGNGLLRQLERADIRWQSLASIFVTHKHLDHLLGIFWMMRMICQGASRGQYAGSAVLYAHEEVAGILRAAARALLAEKDAAHIGSALRIETLADGDEREVLGCPVKFFDIGSTKARQFGFALRTEGGRSLVCCGDEPCGAPARPYAAGADWLMHEAFCLAAEAERFRPREKHHSTAEDAAQLAAQLGVKNLILYHTEDKNLEQRKALYTAEAARHFAGRIFVPDDLEQIELDA